MPHYLTKTRPNEFGASCWNCSGQVRWNWTIWSGRPAKPSRPLWPPFWSSSWLAGSSATPGIEFHFYISVWCTGRRSSAPKMLILKVIFSLVLTQLAPAPTCPCAPDGPAPALTGRKRQGQCPPPETGGSPIRPFPKPKLVLFEAEHERPRRRVSRQSEVDQQVPWLRLQGTGEFRSYSRPPGQGRFSQAGRGLLDDLGG